MRLGTLIFTIMALCALPFSASAAEEKPARFVVHEWGVYVRTRAALAASPGKTQDLLAAPGELVSDLPSFVLRHDKEFKPTRQVLREWRKPVLHFYGADGLEVAVKVRSPQGSPLAYWPRPELRTANFEDKRGSVTRAVEMSWKGKLSARPAGAPSDVPDGHWWSAVREVPGLWFNSDSGTERFIFYEASALQKPPLVARLTADELTLENQDGEDSGPVLVVVNDGVKRRFVSVANVTGKGKVTLTKRDVSAGEDDEAKLLEACRRQWEAFGMTKEEAAAIVATWKPDLIGKVGFLVVARVPRGVYDKMFPLEIAPKPDELVRVGVVFDDLPGEDARLAWLPGLEAGLEAWAADLGADRHEVRRAAYKRFLLAGDIAKPVLERLAKSDDPELRISATELLEKLKPVTLDMSPRRQVSLPKR